MGDLPVRQETFYAHIARVSGFGFLLLNEWDLCCCIFLKDLVIRPSERDDNSVDEYPYPISN